MICTHQQIVMGDQFEKNDIGGALARMGKRSSVCRVFLGKS